METIDDHLPPPQFENFLAAGILAGVLLLVPFGAAHEEAPAGAAGLGAVSGVYAAALGLALWRVRPEEGGRLWFSIWFVPMLLQAVVYATFWLEVASGGFPAPGRGGPAPSGETAGFAFWFMVFGALPALGLVATARRALPLFLVELFAPVAFGLLGVLAS